jgi:hypothetical protein
VTQDIPITTYCQKGSYSAGSAEKKALVANTKPRNWRNLLEIPGLETLLVNLAHMGGDDAIETLFKGGKLTPRGWTYTIIQMLKKYPNVYADLSAYDYHAQGGASRIRRIFELDKKGQFGAGHSLEDKVLWAVPRSIPMASHTIITTSSGGAKPSVPRTASMLPR